MDIKRLTKKSKSKICFNFSIFCDRGQGRALGVVARGFEVNIFIDDTLYQHDASYFKFSSGYFIGLPTYGLHKEQPEKFIKGM